MEQEWQRRHAQADADAAGARSLAVEVEAERTASSERVSGLLARIEEEARRGREMESSLKQVDAHIHRLASSTAVNSGEQKQAREDSELLRTIAGRAEALSESTTQALAAHEIHS